MTPQEKAKELVTKFDEQLNHLASGTNGIEIYIYEQAKNCALIAVDNEIETLTILNHYCTFNNPIKDIITKTIIELKETKQEIEKL